MAYQNVGTPRFYISYGDWWRSIGSSVPREQTISPHETIEHLGKGTATFTSVTAIPPSSSAIIGINWFAALNHNVTSGFGFRCKHWISGTQQDIGLEGSWDTMVNLDIGGSWALPYPSYKGFSLGTWNTPWTDEGTNSVHVGLMGVSGNEPDTLFDIGCWIYGGYYDMPHSPDLNLTMTREYGGIKTLETKGGASLSNAFYTKPPAWGDAGAWELYTGTPTNQAPSRSGRRVWDLSFSYLQDSDVFGSNQSLSHWEGTTFQPIYPEGTGLPDTGDWTSDNGTPAGFNYNILTDDNFYSQVWHKTLGGTLPFIFQPDSSNNNPDQFAICKFKDNSLKATQSAFNVYDISLSIEEVW